MKGNDKCGVCWGTGFYKGYGAPCTEGKIHSGPECRYDPADAVKAGRSIPQWGSPRVTAPAAPAATPPVGFKFKIGDRVRYATKPTGTIYEIVSSRPSAMGGRPFYDVKSEKSGTIYINVEESKLAPWDAVPASPQINFKKGDRVRWSSPSAPPRDGTVIDRSIHGTVRVHLDGDIGFSWCSPHNLTHLSAAPASTAAAAASFKIGQRVMSRSNATSQVYVVMDARRGQFQWEYDLRNETTGACHSSIPEELLYPAPAAKQSAP